MAWNENLFNDLIPALLVGKLEENRKNKKNFFFLAVRFRSMFIRNQKCLGIKQLNEFYMNI